MAVFRIRIILLAVLLSLSVAFVSLPSVQAENQSGGLPALAAQVAALADRVAKLEGNITESDIAGTYRLWIFGNDLVNGILPADPGTGRPAQIASYTSAGIVTFAAGGTATAIVTDAEAAVRYSVSVVPEGLRRQLYSAQFRTALQGYRGIVERSFGAGTD